VEQQTVADVAACLGGLACAGILLARGSRVLVPSFLVLGVAEVALLATLVPRTDFAVFFGSPILVATLVLCLGLVVVGGLLGFGRWPQVVPVALLAVAPFRVPVSLGDQEGFLLVPLYFVLSAAILELVVRAVRTPESVIPISRLLAVPASLFIALSAISLTWSFDPANGAIQLVFFLFPFAALVAVVSRSHFATWLPRALAVTMVSLACVFAAIGLSQAVTHRLIFEQSVEHTNAVKSFFRVTSLFKDPSVYARELVLAIIVLLVAVSVERVRFAVAAALIAFLWAGMFVSYSQSAMVALVVAVVVIAVLAPSVPGRPIVLAVVGAALLAAPVVAVAASGRSIADLTADRSTLVEVTAPLVYRHPLAGVGVGGQPAASKKEARGAGKERGNASHTTPLTVAAELGALGVLSFVAFLAGAATLLRYAMRAELPFGLAAVGVFVALFTHALFYSGFFENPTMWGTLAAAAALQATRGERVTQAASRAVVPASGA
jgi:hypothetical protein